ncbi:MAG: DUF1553 domain-containing protein [Planctomycetaceae bacterium]|nr:DUF1553 domain-containing protein [Planctomycetaceae bacterium]
MRTLQRPTTRDRTAGTIKRDTVVYALLIRFFLVGCLIGVAVAEEPPRNIEGVVSTPSDVTLFENSIRPLLIDHCIECHNAKKSESGLRLDSRELMLKGGDRGPAISLDQPEDSLLLQTMRHVDDLEMPPDEQLPDHEIAAIEEWIRSGANWPKDVVLGESGPTLRGGPITDAERDFWSFQPITDPTPPNVDGSDMLNDIDRFVLARLEESGLDPMPPATRQQWIRRATFDLTGLPPTPAEVREFVDDPSEDASAKVIDRLLNSSAYGERWGRHWLDVIRYADTAGETADYPTPLSYKYRNWVIDAFNADMPYDEFVRQQIAGDIYALQLVERAKKTEDASLDDEVRRQYRDMLTATGFIAISRRFGFDVENYHHLTIQDTIDVIGQSMLGLTLGCARCHDHKYDPVNMTDYYAWYGIFESTRYSFPGSEEKKRPYDLYPSVPPDEYAELESQFNAEVATLDEQIEQLEKPDEDLTKQRDELKKVGPLPAEQRIYGAIEQEQPTNSHIQLRGEKTRLGDEVPRRNLDILGGDPVDEGAGSGRLQMAEWLTRDDNPLLARVMVNRIWQQHFGRGLVGTENDFGARGERPSHPELLDWLASRFKESGFSIKAMHRLIMNSAAYQRSSEYDKTAADVDPDAHLIWRFNRRRLSAEEIRDAMLFVSGNLDRTRGGAHPFPPVDSWGFTQHNPYYGVYPTNRRSIYLMQQRLKRHPFLGLFDGADANVSTAHRSLTTVPTQALFLMNNKFVHEQSASLATRLLAESDDESTRIDAALQIAFGRVPIEAERQESHSFLTTYREALEESAASPTNTELTSWAAFARTLLTRNDFLFVD